MCALDVSRREAINLALVNGSKSLHQLEAETGLGFMSLYRHKQHLPGQLMKAEAAR